MAARQCEHMDTHISVCNDLIDLKLQEVYSNTYQLRQSRIIFFFSFYNLISKMEVCLIGMFILMLL